ncbi:MAG: SurA N-terminal domain-containing protein, partial [Bacteroidales bacterium]|nr:SurA N-terminal domain-containing protein [Bacteroidales bacterium]
MAALETIRQKFGIGATIIIAFGLLLFLVNPADIMQTIQNASSKYDVGKIGKNSISYTEFDQEVKQLGSVSEMMTGQSASSEAQQTQLRDATWRTLVEDNLFIPNAQAAGINVGHDEIVALMNGENVSPVLSTNPIFQEDGAFSHDRLVDFLQQMESDDSGRMSTIWNYLQKSVKTVQYYNKYNALFTAGAFSNALQTARLIEDNNTSADVRFVMSPLGYTKDTTVVVSDAEIKDYYNKHK